jgi:TerC family integral membrane protein
MLHVTTAGWAATIAAIVLLLALEFVIAGRRPHAVGFAEAVGWSVFYVVAALAFGVVFAAIAGWDFGAQYLAGYLVERSLSVDNLFVFVIIIGTFAVPAEHQNKALTMGIVAALVLRGLFIAAGAALLDAFSVMFLVFGALLLVTAAQLFRHRDEDPSIEDNFVVDLVRRVLPVSTHYTRGQLLTRVEGRRMLTPLVLVFVAIGTTDIVFALDSIPAVFGITANAYIVFTANAFALLGLRSLFFLVSGLLDRLVYLSTGLSLILAFIGIKLVLHYLHTQAHSVPQISTGASLAAIGIVLAVTTAASILKTRRDPSARAHAGSLRERAEEAAPETDASTPQG